MNIFKVFVLIICALFLILLLKNIKSSISLFITLGLSIILLIYAINQLQPIVDFIRNLSNKANIKSEYLKIIFKCIAICILGDFTSNFCKDTGESSLAYNSELVCKISIILISLPMYIDIFNLILKLWES